MFFCHFLDSGILSPPTSDREKLLKFEAEFANFLRSLEQFIQTVKGQNDFLTFSWRFLRLYRLEQLKSKLEKIIGIEKHAGKVRKYPF